MLQSDTFKALAAPHKDVHAVGKDVLAAFWHGDRKGADAHLKILHEKSQRVVELLELLKDVG